MSYGFGGLNAFLEFLSNSPKAATSKNFTFFHILEHYYENGKKITYVLRGLLEETWGRACTKSQQQGVAWEATTPVQAKLTFVTIQQGIF